MVTPSKIPTHVVGNASPLEGAANYILRTGEPFVITRVVPSGLLAQEFHLLNASVKAGIAASAWDKIMQGLADFAASEIDEDEEPGAPWKLRISDSEAMPKFLLCDNSAADFTAILHAWSPRFWLVMHDHAPRTVVPIDDFAPSAMPTLVAAASAFYQDFCRQEDALGD